MDIQQKQQQQNATVISEVGSSIEDDKKKDERSSYQIPSTKDFWEKMKKEDKIEKKRKREKGKPQNEFRAKFFKSGNERFQVICKKCNCDVRPEELRTKVCQPRGVWMWKHGCFCFPEEILKIGMKEYVVDKETGKAMEIFFRREKVQFPLIYKKDISIDLTNSL